MALDSQNPKPPLLEVNDLKTHFPVRKGVLSTIQGYVYALDGVSITVNDGETLGLVGESGSGKSTLGKSVLRIVEPTSGEIKIRGKNIIGLSKSEMFAYRREVQMVFQDPYSSLNPRIPVGKIVAEVMRVHGIASGREARERVNDIFEKVGLWPSQTRNYANEFSGGQRQRIGIARALALNPSLIIADEPVSALDVSVQAQVINLFMDLQEEFGISRTGIRCSETPCTPIPRLYWLRSLFPIRKSNGPRSGSFKGTSRAQAIHQMDAVFIRGARLPRTVAASKRLSSRKSRPVIGLPAICKVDSAPSSAVRYAAHSLRGARACGRHRDRATPPTPET
jgi:ABC-type dipeptide/oligopeptide/nickel transport system ATPase subunit